MKGMNLLAGLNALGDQTTLTVSSAPGIPSGVYWLPNVAQAEEEQLRLRVIQFGISIPAIWIAQLGDSFFVDYGHFLATRGEASRIAAALGRTVVPVPKVPSLPWQLLFFQDDLG